MKPRTQQGNSQGTKSKRLAIQAKNLISEKKLGSGNNGEVFRCEYTGDDEAIRSLCIRVDRDGVPHYWCAMKISKRGQERKLADEQKVFDHLRRNWLSKHPDEPIANCPYCLGMGATLDGKEIIILRLECYGVAENSMQSSDLLNFLGKMLEELDEAQRLPPPIQAVQSAFQDLTTRAQVLGSLYHGIIAMHQPVMDVNGKVTRPGCMHNDIALRNSLMSLFIEDSGFIVDTSSKPTDYGLAVVLDEYYCAEHADEPEAAPIKWMSRVRMSKEAGTFRSPLDDLFAYRVALLESLCSTLKDVDGCSIGLPIGVEADGIVSDTYIMNLHLRFIKDQMSELPASESKEQPTLFLDAFQEYLVNVQCVDFKPLSAYNGDETKRKEAIRDDVQTKLKKDKKILEQAYEKLFISQLAYHLFRYQHGDKNAMAAAQMLAEIKRLLSNSIVISDEFKKSVLYQQCLKIKDNPISAIMGEANVLISAISTNDVLKIPLQDAKSNYIKSVKKMLDDFKKLQILIVQIFHAEKYDRGDLKIFKSADKLTHYLNKECAFLQKNFPGDELTKEIASGFNTPKKAKKSLEKLCEDLFLSVLTSYLFKYQGSKKQDDDVSAVFKLLYVQHAVIWSLHHVSDIFKSNDFYTQLIEGEKIGVSYDDPDRAENLMRSRSIIDMLLNNATLKPRLAAMKEHHDHHNRVTGFLNALKECFNIEGEKDKWEAILNSAHAPSHLAGELDTVLHSTSQKTILTKEEAVKILGLKINKNRDPGYLLGPIVDVINASTNKSKGKSQLAINLVEFLKQHRELFDDNQWYAAIEKIDSKIHQKDLSRWVSLP